MGQTSSFVSDVVDIKGHTQGNLAISSVAAQTAALASGLSVVQSVIYDVWSDVDCYIKVAATANDVTTATGYLLRANNTMPIVIRPDDKIGAITSSASGTLYFHRIGNA